MWAWKIYQADYSSVKIKLFWAIYNSNDVQMFTTGSCLELLPCVKFIAPETILCLGNEIVEYPYA